QRAVRLCGGSNACMNQKKGKTKENAGLTARQGNTIPRPPVTTRTIAGSCILNNDPKTDPNQVQPVLSPLPNSSSKPIVLDSGATHHLINNPDTFKPSAESNIKIATGGHNFLNATDVETATLVNHLENQIVLKNALL
ncbi:hypothetical protein VP01_10340g1, partial [Puccinia sorghi]